LEPINKKGVVVIDGHVQGLALTRSLGEKGIPVIIVDRNNYGIARYSKYCLGFYRSPEYLTEDFIDFLLELNHKKNLKDWLLLPCDDHIVVSISKRKSELESLYKVITVNYSLLKNIISKRNLFKIALECGLPVIKSHYPETWELTTEMFLGFRFPVLLKGIEGQTFYKKTKHKAYNAVNFHSLKQHMDNLTELVNPSEIMIQEMIPLTQLNKVISFTAFCIDGEIKTYWMGQKIREHPIYYGTATLSQSIFNKILINQSTPLLEKLKYTGVCEVEYLYDPRDEKYYLIEINPRTWLWVGLAKACGIDYAIMIYNYLNNIPQSFTQHYKTGMYWKNEITDLIFSIIGIVTGKINIKSFWYHLFKNKIKALYQKGDGKPFWMFLFLLPYIKSKR